MLRVDDIRGVYVLPPTPCRPDAEGWDSTDSGDPDETAAMTEFLLKPGVAGLGLFGTGDGHSKGACRHHGVRCAPSGTVTTARRQLEWTEEAW
jgi:hypothetical protein